MGFIMALDQGTTSSRCILFDKQGIMHSVAQKEFTQIYPRPGWVEHDPMEIWSSQLSVAAEAMAKIGAEAKDIEAIGITNQRETTVVWDRETGLPIYNAIVWQCRRTAGEIDRLVQKGLSEKIRKKTGLIPDAYFSGTKIQWILEHVPGARKKSGGGKAAIRHHRHLAYLESDQGSRSCYRLYQRFPYYAVRYSQSLLG